MFTLLFRLQFELYKMDVTVTFCVNKFNIAATCTTNAVLCRNRSWCIETFRHCIWKWTNSISGHNHGMRLICCPWFKSRWTEYITNYAVHFDIIDLCFENVEDMTIKICAMCKALFVLTHQPNKILNYWIVNLSYDKENRTITTWTFACANMCMCACVWERECCGEILLLAVDS